MVTFITLPSGACNGEVALLDLRRGQFGSDYDKDESCQWRIEVDDDQVGMFLLILIYTNSLL